MKLVFATHNANKLKEIKKLMPEAVELLSLGDIGCHEDIAETADTIEGNALIKANYIKDNYGYDCFADDTGLEVNALDGAPGVHSARYGSEDHNDAKNIEKLLKNLAGNGNRKAHFKTVIALVTDSETETFTGICEGKILEEKRGEKGFGYDPVFLPDGFDLSFAEMSMEQKNQISHRGRALQKLIIYLQQNKLGNSK